MLKWPGHNCVQIMCNTLGAYQVQHAVYHIVKKDNSAIMFDRVEITFILEGNQSTQGKPQTMSFRKCHTLKLKIQSPTETQSSTLALMAGAS